LAPTGLVSEPRGDLIFRGDRGLVSEPRGDLTYRGDLTCRGDLRLEVPKTGLKQHKFYSVNNTCSGLFGAVWGCSGLFGAVRGCYFSAATTVGTASAAARSSSPMVLRAGSNVYVV
jgi:hypothetical protein